MQLEWLISTLGILGVIAIIGFLVVFVVVGALLGVALGLVKGQNRQLGSTFGTAFYVALTWLVMLIPIAGVFLFCLVIILQWYIIKSRHEIDWAGAIVVWIITMFMIGIVFVVIFFAFGGLALLLPVIPWP